MIRACFPVCLLVLIAPVLAWAQDETSVVLLGDLHQTAKALQDDIHQKLKDNKIVEAFDQLQNLVDRGGDDLIESSNKIEGKTRVRTLVAVRRQAHLLISELPPETLALYRRRVDAQAQRWLDQGLEQHQSRFLRLVVERAFCSQAGEKALDALGDLAFERGDFDEAECWWQMLLPRPKNPTNSSALHYPAARIPPARTQAKLILARLFRDGATAIREELALFRKSAGQAEGMLAGRQGRYGDILQDLSRTTPDTDPDLAWTTFGGTPQRNLVGRGAGNLTDVLAALCRQTRVCIDLAKRRLVDLENGDDWLRTLGSVSPAIRNREVLTATQAARSLAFHPVIAGGYLLVSDARHVVACDLQLGTVATWFDAARVNGGIRPRLDLPAVADLRYTLTVADDCVFARLGTQAIAVPQEEMRPNTRPESLLVCLRLTPDANGDRLRWQVRPGIIKDHAVFEGTPLVANGLVWIASTRHVVDRAVTSIHCYPVASQGSPPTRWRKDICEVRETTSEPPRYRHHLLTRVGPYIVYASHQGGIVALDAATGERAWAVSYPSRTAKPDEPAPLTDLTPCLSAAGRLYVAPADSDRLFCLDPTTGEVLWQRPHIRVVHLLGVSHPERPDGTAPPLLFVTTSTGLLAINAATGRDEGGWCLPDSGGPLPPLGRGLLVGDLVLWPTVKGIYAVRQVDGNLVNIPNLRDNVPAGNLAWGQGCLAVATRTHLFLYTPPSATRRGQSPPGANTESP